MSQLAPNPAVIALIVAASWLAGCGSSEDREIEHKLGSVSTHRAEHLHYPVTVFGDFGSDNPPIGIAIDAYGPYIHETTKVNPSLTALSQAEASEKVAHTFEQAIKGIRAAEATTPAPKPPLPVNVDWRSTPHPKAGSYLLVTKFGSVTHKFEFQVAAGDKDLGSITQQIKSDASQVIDDGHRAQSAALASNATPNGFRLSTTELITKMRGSRDPDTHLSGGPFLLTPVDRDLALKGLDRSIRKLLNATAKLDPAPSVAHLEVDGPGFERTYAISLTNQLEMVNETKSVLADMSDTLNRLNRA